MLGIESVFDTKVEIDENDRMVVVAYLDNTLLATKGSLGKHHRQVPKVF